VAIEIDEQYRALEVPSVGPVTAAAFVAALDDAGLCLPFNPSRYSETECRRSSKLPFAKTPSGRQVVDLSALIRPISELDDYPPALLASALPVPRHNAPAMVGEHDEDKEHTQAGAGDGEEIDGDDVPDMVGEERAPGLRRGCAPLRH
jgi:hypothetical protein